MAKRVRLRTREAIIHFHGHEIARFIFYTYTPRSGIRPTESSSILFELKFGYVVVRPRYSGGSHRQFPFLLLGIFLQAPKVGKSQKSLFLALIFFLKIHREAPLGFGTLKFCMNMLIAYI